eukprot:5893991-Karenia_brevis.AAC.1
MPGRQFRVIASPGCIDGPCTLPHHSKTSNMAERRRRKRYWRKRVGGRETGGSESGGRETGGS